MTAAMLSDRVGLAEEASIVITALPPGAKFKAKTQLPGGPVKETIIKKAEGNKPHMILTHPLDQTGAPAPNILDIVVEFIETL